MDNNQIPTGQPNLGSAPNIGTTQAPNVNTAQAMPLDSMPSNGSFGNFAPVAVPINSKPKRNWWMWGLLGICGVVLVVVVCIFLPKMLGGPDYGESYKLANEFYEQLEEIMGSRTSACYKMTYNENDSDVSMSEYREYISGCKEDISKARDLADKLSKSSGITKDDDLKKQYEALEAQMNKAIPQKQGLDKMEKIFAAVHEFSIRLMDIDSDSSEAEVKEAAKILANSGSSDWAEYGKGWETKMLQYLQAAKAYDGASYSDSNYSSLRSDYSEALSDLRDYLADFDASDWDNGGFNVAEMDDWNDAAYELKEAVRELYEQNYDGKNDEDCTDFGDGEASCR